MPQESIYGAYGQTLYAVMRELESELQDLNKNVKEETGEGLYEHLICRVKTDESMRDKCVRKGLEQTSHCALREIYDAIGIRVITRFVDDIFLILSYMKGFSGVEIVTEKDYIRHAKPNGYRSYHVVLKKTVPFEDVDGNNPGFFYVEVQLRTIAMDSWASLEHQVKYKKDIKNQKLIVSELKRCADELASCDLSMQTIRNLIRESDAETGGGD